MIYAGPERRRCSRIVQLQMEYDNEYARTRSAAATWSVSEVTEALQTLMHKPPYYEDVWGMIDALADILSEARR